MTTGRTYGAFLKLFARSGAQLSVAVGIVVMIGWFLDVAAMKSVVPGLATMKMNTAFAFVAAGISLWLPHAGGRDPWLHRLACGLALLVTALGALTLAEYLFGLHLGIDQLIIREDSVAAETLSPGRMSPASAFNLLILGSALLCLKAPSPRFAALVHWLVVPPLLIATIAILGYAYGVESLYRVAADTPMALHTAFLFFVLSLSILAADSKYGFALVAASDTAGGLMARWMLPIIPTALFLLGWIRLQGQQAGYYDFRFGLALMVALSITVCGIAVAWTANILHKTDTSRKNAEIEIIKLNLALELRRTEELFRTLVSGVKEYAILVLDRQGRVVSWNEGAERIKGYRADEIIGEHFSRFYLPEDVASGKPAAALAQVVAEGKFEEEGWRVRKDQSRFWAHVLIAPLYDDNGGLRGFTKITRDVTERRNAEILLSEKMKELSRSNEELAQFASMAAHDLQEPLRMVSSYVELLSKRYKDKLDTSAEEFIAIALDGVTRMRGLIRDLLAYSRAGAAGLELHDISSEKSLQRALVNLGGTIEASGALVTHDPLPAVRADDMQLTQLFQNLVGNAIKYQRFGIPKIHVGAVRAGEAKWDFSVRDNGIGIDPGDFGRIFGMLQRLNNRSEFEGTGIGLAICKKIVERHGGEISVESQPGQGSTFHFVLAEAATIREKMEAFG